MALKQGWSRNVKVSNIDVVHKFRGSIVPIHFQNTTPLLRSRNSDCRPNSQDSGNVAQHKCQVAEGSNGAVLALTAKVQSTSVVPKSHSSPGLSKCATGTPGSNNCPSPASNFFQNFSRNAILFTRASTQSNNLTHWGRVTQICVFTLQLCKTDDANLRF